MPRTVHLGRLALAGPSAVGALGRAEFAAKEGVGESIEPVATASQHGRQLQLVLYDLTMIDLRDAFDRNPKICGGQPVFRGTRVPLRTVLASLAEGATFDEILREFPTLTEEHVRTAVAFAASSAQEDLPVPGAPPV